MQLSDESTIKLANHITTIFNQPEGKVLSFTIALVIKEGMTINIAGLELELSRLAPNREICTYRVDLATGHIQHCVPIELHSNRNSRRGYPSNRTVPVEKDVSKSATKKEAGTSGRHHGRGRTEAESRKVIKEEDAFLAKSKKGNRTFSNFARRTPSADK